MTQRRAIKGTPHQADVESLYRGENELSQEIAELAETVANLPGGGDDDTNPFTVLAPCTPDFVVDRIIEAGKGEDPICCVNYPQGTPAVQIKTVLRQYKKDGVTLQAESKKFFEVFSDITDDNNEAGILNYRFGRFLGFKKKFALWQLIITDEAGHKLKARDEDSVTPLAIFETGSPTLGPPNGHNLLRNGRLERSKYKSVPAATAVANGWTVPVEGNEAWAWFINCDRERPLTTSTYTGTSARPNSGNPLWNKAAGNLSWSSELSGPSQRFPHRVLRASDVVFVSGWVAKDLIIGTPLTATLLISIVSVSDLRPGGSLLTTILSTVSVPLGNSLVAPASILAPGPPPDPPIAAGITVPFQAAIQMPAGYTVGSTPAPANNSSGQWLWLRLTDSNGGSGQFVLDRIRVGYGDADWSPHPDEYGDGVEDVDITGGGGRGGGSTYGATPNALEPGQSGILRPVTD